MQDPGCGMHDPFVEVVENVEIVEIVEDVQLAAVFLQPLWASGKWWGEPGIETQEVGGEASPGQIQGKENADTIGKDIGVGECTILSHALKKFQAHAHYKEPNAQPQLRGPLRIDVSKP